MSAWINMIEDNDADENLLEALNASRSPHGTVDNVLRVHSLRPVSYTHLRAHET